MFIGIAHAQTTRLQDILDAIIVFFPLLIWLVISIGIFLFFWGLAVFILRAGDEKGREEGRDRMIWGVVILFVFVSLWGILGVLMTITGLGNQATCPPPRIGTDSVSSCL